MSAPLAEWALQKWKGPREAGLSGDRCRRRPYPCCHHRAARQTWYATKVTTVATNQCHVLTVGSPNEYTMPMRQTKNAMPVSASQSFSGLLVSSICVMSRLIGLFWAHLLRSEPSIFQAGSV